MDLSAYLPVILFILVGTVIGILPQALGFLLGPKRPDAMFVIVPGTYMLK